MGIVLLAEKNSEGVADLVALKTIRTKSADHEMRLKQEANIATGLRHENIVKTYGLEAIPYSQLPASLLTELGQLQVASSRKADIASIAPGQRKAGAPVKNPPSERAAAPTDDRKLVLM